MYVVPLQHQGCERGLSLLCSLEGPHLPRDQAFKPGYMEASELESWVLGLEQEQLPRQCQGEGNILAAESWNGSHGSPVDFPAGTQIWL